MSPELQRRPSGHQAHDSSEKLFGIPRYYQAHFGGRNYNYEQKYPPDPLGEEAREEARIWSTYLDEAESHDHDMIQGFRDTIDSLLVLAGLFSAIVATFVAQTSQSLRPYFAQLNLIVQMEQTALLRMGGNISAMNMVPMANITPETPTYTRADLWINGLFFTSLSLSMTTALLAVLVKQWCQAYTSITSGSAKHKCLTRQFRFDGLVKWKLPEIVGSLPLLLHLAFGIFFAGLSYFVYDIHGVLSAIVITTFFLTAIAYFGTILLPAIWLECPYRIQLLFRPARFLVILFILLRGAFMRYLWGSSINPALSQYLPSGEWKTADVLTSLKNAEEVLLSIPHSYVLPTICPPVKITARSFSWLFTLSNNKSTRRIVAAVLHGCITDEWKNYPSVYSNLSLFLKLLPYPVIAEFTLENLLTPGDDNQVQVPLALLDVLHDHHCNSAEKESSFPLSQASLDRAILSCMKQPAVYHQVLDSLVRWGANVNSSNPSDLTSPFLVAVANNNLNGVRWLVQVGADINIRRHGRTPLIEACHRGHIDLAKYLVQSGADLNAVGHLFDSCTALTLALLGQPNFEFAEYLLDHGAVLELKLNGSHDTALHRVVQAGEVEAVRFLLERGAFVTSTLAQRDRIMWKQWVTHDECCQIELMLSKFSAIDYRTGTLRTSQCLSSTRLLPVLSRQHLA